MSRPGITRSQRLDLLATAYASGVCGGILLGILCGLYGLRAFALASGAVLALGLMALCVCIIVEER